MDQNPDIYIKEGDKRIRCSYCALLVTTTQTDLNDIKSLFVKTFKPMIYQGRIFERGIIDDKLFVVVYPGTGMINMTLTVQLSIDKFKPCNIIGIGYGGSSSYNNTENSKKIHSYGDIVIPKRWADISYLKFIPTDKEKNCYRDGMINYPDQNFQISEGYCTSYHNPIIDGEIGVRDEGKIVSNQICSLRSGILMKSEHLKTEIDDDNNQMTIIQDNSFWLTVSTELLDLVENLIIGSSQNDYYGGPMNSSRTKDDKRSMMQDSEPLTVNRSQGLICPKSLTNKETEVKIVSIGLSSHFYINNQNYDARLKTDFNYDVIDTSSFALLTTATSANIPSIIIKGIGYHLGLNPGDKDYQSFEDTVSAVTENCIYLLERLILVLPDPDQIDENKTHKQDITESDVKRDKSINSNDKYNTKPNSGIKDSKIKHKSSRRRKLRGFYDEESVQYMDSIN